jgi:kumamolisin
VPNGDGRSGRAIPDVAAHASPTRGYVLFINGQRSVIGGTSTAAALWAGLIALFNQGIGKNVGFINPLLYEHLGPEGDLRNAAAGPTSAAAVKACSSSTGWNPCTGWGSPNGKKMMERLRTLLKSR